MARQYRLEEMRNCECRTEEHNSVPTGVSLSVFPIFVNNL